MYEQHRLDQIKELEKQKGELMLKIAALDEGMEANREVVGNLRQQLEYALVEKAQQEQRYEVLKEQNELLRSQYIGLEKQLGGYKKKEKQKQELLEE